jgi:hypothetical protein
MKISNTNLLVVLFSIFFIYNSTAQLRSLSSAPKSVEAEKTYQRKLNKGLKGIKGSGIKPTERYLNTMEKNQVDGKSTNHARRIIDAFNDYQKSHDSSIESKRFSANWEYYGAENHTWVSPFVNNSSYNWYGTIEEYTTSGGWNSGVGRLNCIEFDPMDSDVIYVGTAYGGVWKSINSGTSWTNINNNLPILSISDIVVDYTNSNNVYILTGDYDGKDQPSVGVYKSINGGGSWNATGLQFTQDEIVYCGDIKMNPINPNEIFVGCSDALYYSSDFGNNFDDLVTGTITDIEFHPTNTDSLYIGSICSLLRYTLSDDQLINIYDYNCAGSENYRLEIAVTDYIPDAVAVVSSRVLDLFGDSDRSLDKLIVSGDAGDNFQIRATSPNMMHFSLDGSGTGGQGNYDIDVEFVPTDTSTIYIAGVNLWKSTDGGVNFNIESHWNRQETSVPYVHGDIHDIAFNSGGSKPYLACDGGIFIRHPILASIYYDMTSDMGINQFYDIDIIEQDVNRVIGATQDNGSNYLNSFGTMNQVRGADGMAVMYAHNNPNKYYTARQYGGLEVTVDNGLNWDFIKPKNVGNFPFIVDYVMHPTDSDIIFGAVDHIARTLDGGATSWDAINLPNTKRLTAIEIGKNDPNILYVTEGQIIWRVDNCLGPINQMTITNINSNINFVQGGPQITKIAVNPSDALDVYVTMSGYTSDSKVLHSIDGGANWTNVSNGLPNVPVYTLLYEDGSNDVIYAGTALGVYYSEAGSDWNSFTNGLPPVQVNDMEINYNTREIYAGTFGRGIYRRDLLTLSCPDTINLTFVNDPDPIGNTMTQEYDSNHTINSTRCVDGVNADVVYNAVNRIRLKPGFKATANSKFKAKLKSCD